jgi:hypothetical protein
MTRKSRIGKVIKADRSLDTEDTVESSTLKDGTVQRYNHKWCSWPPCKEKVLPYPQLSGLLSVSKVLCQVVVWGGEP